ncbi:MAG: ribosome biogenesis GTPase Der [Calditrichaceae bacterium]|nr:ribosome biogenesis GTPase Der [Calditrichaceae bacterium]MBN2707512.1 ribosome biogenesis GTPase Der [Calditrichaceae bacterium]RQV95601.1 MAG: ribosome biogenesis GTPase Der [Calditrichota bacterium]
MGIPTVAIVGRPNVGKSTLFNRLIGKRKAIVDDQPGVTRDRIYDIVEWSGQQFALIDTGGYLPESSQLMDAAIKEQVDIAVDESDLVLFLVDAQTGITEVDEQIARRLQKSGKDVVVAVNKIDSDREDQENHQFYRLGLGDPVPVSAMTGRQSGDLLDVVIKKIKKYQYDDEPADQIKLAIIGRENVGKSSLVNMLLNQNRAIVTEIPGTTRDSIDINLNYQKRSYLLIDTAGLKKKRKIRENILFYSNLRTRRSIQRADVVIYMVDIQEGISRQDIMVLAEAAAQRKGLVLALNKWDLIEKDYKTSRELEKDINDKLGVLKYIPKIFISVLDKQRLYKAIDLATEVYEERKKRIPTSELNDFFLPLIKANTPPAVKGKEIKINYVTQVQANPPVIVFYGNHPELIVESYQRFLENQMRRKFGFSGVPLLISFRKK